MHECRFAGSRLLKKLLRTEGHAVGRKHVATLMRRMGIEALYRKKNTSKHQSGLGLTDPKNWPFIGIAYGLLHNDDQAIAGGILATAPLVRGVLGRANAVVANSGVRGAVAEASFAQPIIRSDGLFSRKGQEIYSAAAGREIKTVPVPQVAGEKMKFHVSAAKQVLNPKEWLPSYGESSANFRSEGSDVVVSILYEAEKDGVVLVKRELRFVGVCSFCKSAFPGPAVPSVTAYDGTGLPAFLGSLIQFEHSDVADAWSAHFANRPKVKHYIMQFLSENVEIEVFAAGYELSEETSV